jgi:uncharacterized protein
MKTLIRLLGVWVVVVAGTIHLDSVAVGQEPGEESASAQSEREKKLLDAVARGDVKEVEALLAAGVNPDGRHGYGQTSLMRAALEARVEIARHLIESGADVNLQNNYGENALIWAAYPFLSPESDETARGKDQIVEMLIAAGADVNANDDGGNTPLLIAARNGRSYTARILLEAHADPNHRNRSGVTPLMAAANPEGIKRDKPGVIKLLARAGVDLNAKDRATGNTVLISAARIGTEYWTPLVDPDEIIKALLSSGAEVNARNNQGDTALIEAVKGSYRSGRDEQSIVRMIEILIAGGADVNAENDEGETALKLAAVRSNSHRMGVFNALIASRVKIDLVGPTGETALLLAIRRAAGRSSSEIVEALIKAGADVNVRDDEGTSALIVAVRESGNVEIVRLLLDAGARPDDRDQPGDTALIAALREYLPSGDSDNEVVRNALRRDPEVIRALLAAGSDPAIKGQSGLTALEIATKAGRKDLIQMLQRTETKQR